MILRRMSEALRRQDWFMVVVDSLRAEIITFYHTLDLANQIETDEDLLCFGQEWSPFIAAAIHRTIARVDASSTGVRRPSSPSRLRIKED